MRIKENLFPTFRAKRFYISWFKRAVNSFDYQIFNFEEDHDYNYIVNSGINEYCRERLPKNRMDSFGFETIKTSMRMI